MIRFTAPAKERSWKMMKKLKKTPAGENEGDADKNETPGVALLDSYSD